VEGSRRGVTPTLIARQPEPKMRGHTPRSQSVCHSAAAVVHATPTLTWTEARAPAGPRAFSRAIWKAQFPSDSGHRPTS
jgi:hypothetical protein